eukprot:COSAG01_NODE_860_length_13064_cov_23.466949_7_plen_72_part_00
MSWVWSRSQFDGQFASAAKSALCEIRCEKQAVNSLGMREVRAGIAPQTTQGGGQHLRQVGTLVIFVPVMGS